MSSKRPHGRVKKLMQGTENTGQVSTRATEAMCLAVEAFVSDLMQQAEKMCKKREKERIELVDLKVALEAEKRFDFLRSVHVEEPVRAYRPTKRKRKITTDGDESTNTKSKTSTESAAGDSDGDAKFDTGTYFIADLEQDGQDNNPLAASNSDDDDDDFD